jgi:integrase
MAKASLTEKIVKDAKSGTVPSLIWDTHDKAPKGFLLRTYASRKQSFGLQYTNANGVGRRIMFGSPSSWTVEAARARAKELRVEVDRGNDPLEERRERREAPTMTDLSSRYLVEVLPGLNRNATAKRQLYRATDTRKVLAEVVKRLGPHTPVASVHYGDVKALHAHFTEDRGGPRANRVLALVSKMFSLSLIPLPGEDRPWRTPDLGNPARGIQRNHEEARGQFYSAAQIAAIGQALTSYPSQRAADCVRFIIATGCRPIEAMRAKWSELDDEPGIWKRPSAHIKVKRPLAVPLSAPALELVERLRRERRGDELVFPGKGGHEMVTLAPVWKHVRAVTGLGIKDRLYDARHSFATAGAQAGLSLQVIGALLGHSVPQTTLKYARHLQADPLKQAVDKIAAAITPPKKSAELHDIASHRKKRRR